MHIEPRRLIHAALVLAALQFPTWEAAAQSRQSVDLLLVLAVDTSSSIGSNEYAIQAQGYADAFRDPLIVRAIEDLGDDGLGVTFLQWSASFQMFQSVGWTRVRDGESAETFARAIETNLRRFSAFGTALGDAIGHSVDLIRQSRFTGRRRVIDISSDERSNMGAHPSSTRRKAADAGITVNGLVILNSQTDLVDYFNSHVITGDGAFVIVVDDKDDVADAIRRKLLREIAGPMAGLPARGPDSVDRASAGTGSNARKDMRRGSEIRQAGAGGLEQGDLVMKPPPGPVAAAEFGQIGGDIGLRQQTGGQRLDDVAGVRERRLAVIDK